PVLSTMLQCVWIVAMLGVAGAVGWVAVFEVIPAMLRNFTPAVAAMVGALTGLAALLVYVPVSIGWTVLLKRALIGRYEATRIPAWSEDFIRHWMVTNAARMIPWWLLEGSTLTATALRALGAHVGERVHIHRGVDLWRGGWDLLSIGDDATVAQDVSLRTVELSDGQLIVGPITIGDGGTVDVHAGMSPHSALGRNAYLTPLSWLPAGSTVPDGERWDGVPATADGTAPDQPELTVHGELSPALHAALIVGGRGAGWLVAFGGPLVILAYAWPAFPRWIEAPALSVIGLVVVATCSALALALVLMLQAALMRLAGRVPDGVVSHWSMVGVRIWLKTGTLESAGNWLAGSIFWPWWLRIAGMQIGPDCEISTIIDVLPETITIGEGSFFADGIYLAPPWRHRGTITVAPTSLGRRTFLGNHAVLPEAPHWPDGLFAGVATAPDPSQARPDSAWFGHPPIELPRRHVVAAARRDTHRPGMARFATRLFWESLRFVLPMVPVIIACEWYALLSSAAIGSSAVTVMLFYAPLLTVAGGVVLCLKVVALKWLLLGRTRPGQRAFWSGWCGRWDFLYMAWEKWAVVPLSVLEGTLLLNAFLRLTGVHIGRRVLLGPGNSQMV
ncbi:MAG TPA: hypothetical protein VGH84_14855, partial [Steroidobacteraceae bacterium]